MNTVLKMWPDQRLIQHTYIHPFNGPFSGTTQVSRYQKGKTNPDFTEARDNEWQWHQQDHMQVCTSRQTDNHASTPPLSFLQAGCLSYRPTNSVKALKARLRQSLRLYNCKIIFLNLKRKVLFNTPSISLAVLAALMQCSATFKPTILYNDHERLKVS